jgi:hypothetical protein
VIIHGDASTVTQITIDKWREDLKVHFERYEPIDVFNADETGLFFHLLYAAIWMVIIGNHPISWMDSNIFEKVVIS